ncbi:CAAX prenyl protease 2 isoform X2 [Oreochromis niloticus]|uniref:CAAX prenyl protease 2 isoform X2 n=1 Tax=Oreochromis niloticus TaxID=8128 RepID=UPI0006749437|nr:CAAX prenyl protease 2 isoform X2 [Oreochromis niloticus]
MQVENTHPRCFLGLLSCLFLAGLYVGSLYVWRSSSPRDHPSVIKRRCASVLLVSAVSPAVVKTWMHWADVKVDVSVWELMGLRMDGLVAASILPLLLTIVFYLGPLVHSAMDNPKGFTGEMQCALAHFHHVIEERRLGKESMSVILLVAGMQFLYTTVFGAFTAFIFIRTGHVVGPVLCHSFCNSQGLPDISSALQHPQSSALLFLYLLGGLLFLVLLFPLTDQYFYGPIPICSLAPLPASVC